MRTTMTLTPMLVVATAVALTGCTGSGLSSGSGSATSTASSAAKPASTSTPAGATAITGTVVVSAASSLKETFSTLATQFEKAHPGVKVTLNFGGSDTLASQITSGSPVDVFAAASPKTMAVVTGAKDAIGSPVNFAKNKLEIATPPKNPAKIATLADTTTRGGVQLVVCQATTPGAVRPRSRCTRERDWSPSRSASNRTSSPYSPRWRKEADAGMVYQTDVKAAGAKVKGVPFPQANKAIATYPIAAVTTGKNPATGAAFIPTCCPVRAARAQGGGIHCPVAASSPPHRDC